MPSLNLVADWLLLAEGFVDPAVKSEGESLGNHLSGTLQKCSQILRRKWQYFGMRKLVQITRKSG